MNPESSLSSDKVDMLNPDYLNIDDQFEERLVFPEMDLSTDGSSDDNLQESELQIKLSRDEALR